MIIDIHTHTFPPAIAKKALDSLAAMSGTKYFVDGTNEALKTSMNEAGIDFSVVMPVVTGPKQTESINRTAIMVNSEYEKTGILSFGGIHPENENYKEILTSLKENGIKGIKLHPVFQRVYVDDIRTMRIIEKACELGLSILIHGGYDISFGDDDFVTTKHIANVIKTIKPVNMIMAHMGAWNDWDNMLELVSETPVQIDTAFSLRDADTPANTTVPYISVEQFVKIIRTTGSENVFFGSDSPWSCQKSAIEAVKKAGLTDEELENIFYKNAKKLLGI